MLSAMKSVALTFKNGKFEPLQTLVYILAPIRTSWFGSVSPVLVSLYFLRNSRRSVLTWNLCGYLKHDDLALRFIICDVIAIKRTDLDYATL